MRLYWVRSVIKIYKVIHFNLISAQGREWYWRLDFNGAHRSLWSSLRNFWGYWWLLNAWTLFLTDRSLMGRFCKLKLLQFVICNRIAVKTFFAVTALQEFVKMNSIVSVSSQLEISCILKDYLSFGLFKGRSLLIKCCERCPLLSF